MASVARSKAFRPTSGGSLPIVAARKGLSASIRKRNAPTRCHIVQSQHIVNVPIRLLRQNFLSDGAPDHPSGQARNPESPQRETLHDALLFGAETMSAQSQKRN